MIRFLRISLVLLALVAPAHAAAPTCADAYEELSAYARRIDDPAKTYAENARKELFKSSDELTAQLEKATAENHPEKVNLVVIGGGPHSAELYSSYHETNPGLKALVFEKSRTNGTFDAFGPSFSLNSKELKGATGNPVYGSSVPVRLFNREGIEYVPAERMGDATVVAHYAARTPLAYGQEVTEIFERPEGVNWPGRYLVKTRQGINVYTDVIVHAPGMGEPTFRITDAASLALAKSEAAKAAAAAAKGETYVPLVEPLDDTLKRARSLARQNVNFLDFYKPGERVAVVGANYGSMISVEALEGVSPERIYPGVTGAAKGRIDVVWVGQTAKTFDEFKLANTNTRYWPTLEKAYETGHIIPQPGRVVGWRLTTGDETKLGRIAILLKDSDKPVYVDRIVTGTGYENRATDLFQQMVPSTVPAADRGKAIERVIVNGRLDQPFPAAKDVPVPITQKLRIDGRDQDIYLAGQATGFSQGKEIPEEEWKAAKGGFLDLLGRRTEALGHDLARTATHGGDFTPAVLLQSTARTTVPLSLPAASPAARDALTAELELRVALQRAFYPVRLPPNLTTHLALTAGETPALTYDAAGIQKLKQVIDENPELQRAIAEYLRVHSRAWISIGAKADGRPIFESLAIEGSLQ